MQKIALSFNKKRWMIAKRVVTILYFVFFNNDNYYKLSKN